MASGDSDSESEVGAPNGCRWCGLDERSHYRRWKPPVGWHYWEQPTSEQRKARMLARRRHTVAPREPESRYLLCG
jgi:hypothetical protein